MKQMCMNEQTVYGVVGFLAGIIVGMFIAPSLVPQTGFMGMGVGMMGGGDERFSQGVIDQHFIEQMIPHHEGAIAMAELALEKAQHPEIKALAEDIIEAQEREISEMQGWYQEWFGSDVPSFSGWGMGMMEGGMTAMEGDLDLLADADNFDLEFIRQMIPHHEMAVMMAQMLLAGTEREELRTLGENVITSQSSEIEMMQGWYTAWTN